MKFDFYEIDGITARNDKTSAPYIVVTGSMSDSAKIDALAELWECIGDDELIAHMQREGFKVERVPESTGDGEQR